ncbi:MAG: NAD-dependent epimerase/dehydratase family protein [Actinomycetota bacterium]
MTSPGKAVVTGATGFLGGHLSRALTERGWDVHAIARPSSRAESLEQTGVTVHRCGLFDTDALRGALEDARAVFHLAALVTDWGSRTEFFETNVNGTKSVASAAADAGVGRLVHVSTTDVYGFPNDPDRDESSAPVRTGWPYVDSKIAAEDAARTVAAARDLPLTIVRPATIFGPGDKYFVLEIAQYLRAGLVPVVGGGHARPGFAYVENLADVIVQAGTVPAAVGGTYNLHDATGATWREYVSKLADALGYRARRLSLAPRVAGAIAAGMETAWGAFSIRSRPPLTRHAIAILGTEQEFPTQRARRDLEWAPLIDFDQSIARSAEWCRPLLAKHRARTP